MPNGPGFAPMFGEPDPERELELRAAEGQMAEGEGEGPPAETLTDEPPLPQPSVLPPGQAALEREQREEEITRPEVEAHEPGPQPAVREHHVVHIVYTEQRGNARWSTHSVVVGVKPVQLLGLNQARRHLRLQVALSSGDGFYLAIGPKDRVPIGAVTDVAAGVVLPVELVGAYLVPLMTASGNGGPFPPDDLPLDIVREIWAAFVPDSGIQSAGQYAVVSVSEELGDVGLDPARTVPAGAGADR